MRFALINPPWSFQGSIYFGCREPHLPLEFGYSKALLARAGHDCEIIDAHIEGLTLAELRDRVAAMRPDFTVVTTAPSYLFWRCAPPELRVPQLVVQAVRDFGGTIVAIGPHGSTTPRATLKKLDVDLVVLGECEEVLPKLPAAGNLPVYSKEHLYAPSGRQLHAQPHASNMTDLPALYWDDSTIARHAHHHHRFDTTPRSPGAEMETSRGCPYHCTFCAKDNFRESFRRRPIATIAEELDRLVRQGVEYVYFIDEIFLPFRDVLDAIATRQIKFGIQTRIDLWNEEMLDVLGSAGCVSIEAGVESITEEGRGLLDKRCMITTREISDRLIYAKRRVPFVQANLLDSKDDDPADVATWRGHLKQHGVWANEPVPLYPYPGSPEYARRWGLPDDNAWERAHEAYLAGFRHFSEIQDQQPLSLRQLELERTE